MSTSMNKYVHLSDIKPYSAVHTSTLCSRPHISDTDFDVIFGLQNFGKFLSVHITCGIHAVPNGDCLGALEFSRENVVLPAEKSSKEVFRRDGTEDIG